jgi:hypothetical protein
MKRASRKWSASTPLRPDSTLASLGALAAFLALLLARAAPVVAAGVVGSGTPESCTEAPLDAASPAVGW